MANVEPMDRAPRERLSGIVVEKLLERIDDARFEPGDKLPSEQQLCTEFGVSRTVVREAIAALRARNAVDVRHGVGVFVRDRRREADPSLSTQLEQTLTSVLEVLELRLAVESEAAALAAQRCSAAQEAAIHARFRDIQFRLEAGEDTADADFRFHLAIAQATNNRTYVDVLSFLGPRTIPRSQIGAQPDAADYLRRVQGEHQAIVQAVSAREPDAARAAMRTHLTGSYRRYHAIVFSGAPVVAAD